MDEQRYTITPKGEENLFGEEARPAPQSRTESIRARANMRFDEQEEFDTQPVDVDEEDDYEEEYYDDDEAAKRAGKGCLIAFLVVLLIVGAIVGYAWLWLRSEINGGHAKAEETVVLEVGSGAGARTIGALLEENELIANGTVFRMYVRYFSDTKPDFQVGKFEVEPGMGYDEIIEVLSQSEPMPELMTLRVPEGVTLMKVADTFDEAELCGYDEFLAAASDLGKYSDIEFVQRLLQDYDTTVFYQGEGYLYPDTYEFLVGQDAEYYVRVLLQRMDDIFTPEMYARADELQLSVREVLTLASIIQREAGHEEQQATVSGAIWNRLTGNWPQGTLGVDVTITYIRQYIQWTYPEEYGDKIYTDISYDEARGIVGDDLFFAYLADDSYPGARQGLPLGPISSVTYSAINAALYPEDNNYYYFLTTKLGNYYYATTYDEHLANIQTMNAENAEYEQQQTEENG